LALTGSGNGRVAGRTLSVVITENPDELKWALPGNKQFIAKWGVFDYSKLPEKYFQVQDTAAYQIVK